MMNSIRLFKALIAVIITASMVWFTPMVFAQTGGKIAGRIVDSQSGDPLVGTNVIIEGTLLGAAVTASGDYFILNVPAGVYTVTASIIGFQTVSQSEVRVRVGRTTTLDFSLKSAALEAEEAVTVTAERPTIIRDLTATTTHTGSEIFEAAPVENTLDLIKLTAGIMTDEEGDLIVRGGGENEINFYVDGVQMDKQFNMEFGTSNTREKNWKMNFNLLGVQEMEVITGGFNAQYGNAQSGIINVVTKEGGGRFHGDFRFEYGPPGQHHFGRYTFDRSRSIYQNWDSIDKWLAWNDGLTQQWEPDTLRAYFELWKKAAYPDVGERGSHRGGAYDYRDLSYKRAMFAFGGPIRGNRLTFFTSGEYRLRPYLTAESTPFAGYKNIDFTITARIKPTMKLRVKGLYGYNQNAGQQSVYHPQNRGDRIFWPKFDGFMENHNTNLSITWTHTLNPSTFYEFLISVNREYVSSYRQSSGCPDAGNYFWPPDGAWREGWYWTVGKCSNFGSGGMDERLNSYRYRLDFTSQIDPHHQLRFGSDGRVYDGMALNSRMLSNWFEMRQIEGHHWANSRYFAGYLQDKMEYGGLIANLGVRIDRFDGGRPYPFNPFAPALAKWDWVHGDPRTVEQ